MRRVDPADAAAEAAGPPADPAGIAETRETAFRRDRLLAALTLIAGAGLVLAIPFALREGAEFFLPVTAALVIAIALVPMLEWLERRGPAPAPSPLSPPRPPPPPAPNPAPPFPLSPP